MIHSTRLNTSNMLKHNLKLILALLIFCHHYNLIHAQSPQFVWAKSIGNDEFERSTAIATDASGNSIIAGKFNSLTVSFGANVLNNNGGEDIFIAKYDPTGTLLWAKSIGGDYDEEPFSIATDSSGNIIVAGYFSSTSIVCDTITLVNSGSGFGYEALIVKYDPSGNVVWAKKTNGTSNEVALGVATDHNNNIILTGWFDDAVLSFDTDTLTNVNPGSSDMFMIKYDPQGNTIWAKSEGGSASDGFHPVSVDDAGNIIAVGYSASPTISIGTSTFTNLGDYDQIITKYSANGTFLWAKSISGDLNEFSLSIQVDHANNYITYGRYYSTDLNIDSITLNNNDISGATSDIYIIKFDSLGNVNWSKSFGGIDDDVALNFDINSYDDLILGGFFRSPSITVDTFTITNSDPLGYADLFLFGYNSSGNPIWAKSNGESGYDDRINCLSVNNNDDIYITGWYYSPQFVLGNDTLNNVGNTDLFVARLSSCANSSEINEVICSNYISPSGNHIWNISGTYVDIIQNNNGCDSLITIHLTINNNYVTDSIYTCGSYTWIDGNNYTSSNNTATYTLTNTQGCDSVITLNLTIVNQNLNILINNGVLLSSNSGSSYQWLDCNNGFSPISGETNQTFSPTTNGSYAVVVNSVTCSDTSACYNFNSLQLETITNSSSYFPNPVVDFIYFDNLKYNSTIHIMDVQGKIVLSKQIENNKLSLEGLASGCYFYRLTSTNDELETKGVLIKE